MVEIHVLPTNMDSAGAAKLMAALSRAVESGTDLGSRGPHIRALGQSLEQLIALLKDELHKMDEFAFTETSEEALSGRVRQFVSNMERLANLARTYPA